MARLSRRKKTEIEGICLLLKSADGRRTWRMYPKQERAARLVHAFEDGFSVIGEFPVYGGLRRDGTRYWFSIPGRDE